MDEEEDVSSYWITLVKDRKKDRGDVWTRKKT